MTREEQRARKAQQERMRQVERRHKEAARGQMDLPFLILTLLLTVIGLIMLFSASFPRAYYDTGDGTYYFKRQAIFAAIGLVAVFCGAVNCPVASVLLSVELFGSAGAPYFAVACALSYLLSGYCGLYSSQTILYSKLRAEFINVRTHE